MRSLSHRICVVAVIGPLSLTVAHAAQGQGPVHELESSSYCSDGESGEPLATVSWTTSREYLDRQRLDVTAFTTGFDRDVYTTLWPLEAGQAFRPFADVKLPERSDMVVLFLEVRDLNVDRKHGWISIELEGLRSSILYSWRVVTLGQDGWVPSEEVRSHAPICIGGSW